MVPPQRPAGCYIGDLAMHDQSRHSDSRGSETVRGVKWGFGIGCGIFLFVALLIFGSLIVSGAMCAGVATVGTVGTMAVVEEAMRESEEHGVSGDAEETANREASPKGKTGGDEEQHIRTREQIPFEGAKHEVIKENVLGSGLAKTLRREVVVMEEVSESEVRELFRWMLADFRGQYEEGKGEPRNLIVRLYRDRKSIEKGNVLGLLTGSADSHERPKTTINYMLLDK
jgi:hypothetical protein